MLVQIERVWPARLELDLNHEWYFELRSPATIM